jgi:undecaprenyl diphosphate synthase
MSIKNQIDLAKTPQHVAIIMDGNGRWAKKQGQERLFGHNFGVESVREVLKGAKELNIKFLTLYTFSTENWNRPKEEVDGLMNLLVQSVTGEIDELNESGVRLQMIGDLDGLPDFCKEELSKAIEITKTNTDITLVLALNYSAKWEIMRAVNTIASKVKMNEITESTVSEEQFASELATVGIPDPELLIRTSGEHRISNFLLWQIAYTEFHFTDVLWPDFKKEDLFKAVLDFQSRERRFGKVSEQLS